MPPTPPGIGLPDLSILELLRDSYLMAWILYHPGKIIFGFVCLALFSLFGALCGITALTLLLVRGHGNRQQTLPYSAPVSAPAANSYPADLTHLQ